MVGEGVVPGPGLELLDRTVDLMAQAGTGRDRIVLRAQESGTLAVRQIAAGPADRLRQQDLRRHLAARSAKSAHHAADVRMFDLILEQAAGLHQLMARIMDRRPRVMERADERELIGLSGGA